LRSGRNVDGELACLLNGELTGSRHVRKIP
jgi:hypothetical protein